MGELLRGVMAKQTKGTNTRNGKNRALLIGFCIVIFLIMAGIFSSFSKVNDNTDTVSWSLDESGLLSFSGRTLPAVKVSPLEETVNYTLEKISYLDPENLKQFLTSRGRIRSRRQTGLPRRDQARLAREIKRARELALLPYVVPEAESSTGRGRGRRRRDDD
ncbi:MAG TPA: 30S ribosomal protein S18 [Methanoregulaceae archaeon]|nr:30S ribosomal protein S18 [Methanoregulaceae archaeon]